MLTDEFFLGTKLYRQKLMELCKPLIKYLGITHAIYINIDKHGKTFCICSDDKWVERFLEERYYEVDPFMVHPNNMHNGFSFDNASDHQDFKDTLLYEAVTKFNWCNSFAYIEKMDNGSYFGIDFGTAKDNRQVINRLMNESHIIRKFIRDLHKNLVAATLDLQENKMDFAALKGEAFHTQKGLVFNEAHENQSKIKLLEDLGFANSDLQALMKVSLSPQETNCLRSYLVHRNIKEVAREIGLAVTTVASYIENIKNKLNCHHKNDLCEKGEFLTSLGRI